MIRSCSTFIAVTSIAGALVAGCSSSGSRGGGSATGTTQSATSAAKAGSSPAATDKSPITVAWINDQGSSTGASYPQDTIGALAAVDHINKDLGGVGGRQIKLDTCFTDGTPAAATTCANKAVGAKAIIVAMGVVGLDNNVIGVTSKAGLAVLTHAGYSSEITTAGPGKAFVISSSGGGTAGLLGLAKDMQQRSIKKLGIITVNVPGAIGALKVADPGFKKAGLTTTQYPVPYPSPDLFATFSTVKASNPDALMVELDPVSCLAAMKAAVADQWTKPIYAVSGCQTPTFAQEIKQLKVPVRLVTANLPAGADDADAKTYLAAMARYGTAQKDPSDQQAINGFQTIMSLYEGLKAASTAGSALTSDSLARALETQKLHHFMMGPDASFTCDGKAFPAAPSVCSVQSVITTYDNGQSSTEVVDASSLTGS